MSSVLKKADKLNLSLSQILPEILLFIQDTQQGPGLLRKFHVKVHVSQQECSNLPSDRLVAVPSTTQKPYFIL